MDISGVTDENRLVISRVGPLCFSKGIPLELILEVFKKRNLVVDWVDYIDNALADGHNKSTIKSRILAAVGDVHGSVYAKEVAKRLKLVLG